VCGISQKEIHFLKGVVRPEGSIYLVLLTALGPEVYSASNRSEYQEQKKMFLGSRARRMRDPKNLNAICEPVI
jgi:hypothetical protein